MKRWMLLAFVLTGCSLLPKDKNDLNNSIWTNCKDDPTTIVLKIDSEHLYVENDSIFSRENKVLIGVVDSVELDYGARILHLRDAEGNAKRYCE